MQGTSTNGRWRSLGALALGMSATCAYFAAIFTLAPRDGVLIRYSSGHPIEVASIAMFFWGVSDLVLKWLGQFGEKQALTVDCLPASDSPQPASAATHLLQAARAKLGPHADSWMGRRLMNSLHYIREKRSADSLEDHLRYLAEIDSDQSHGSFALVRVIAWMIPILGFLGTVVGITNAISNITPGQLESSLGDVTSGLGVAFDTTAVSLVLSMMLIFLTFLVEKTEQQILHRVEMRAGDLLSLRFLVGESAAAAPHLAVIRSASEAVVAHTRVLVDQQVEVWTRSLGAMAAQYQESHRLQEERLSRTLETLRLEWRADHEALRRSSTHIETLERDLAKVAQLLLKVVEGEGQLVASQQRLDENLRTLRQTQGFGDAIHSLTAAIHLLTIRQPGLDPDNRRVA